MDADRYDNHHPPAITRAVVAGERAGRTDDFEPEKDILSGHNPLSNSKN